MKAKRNRDNNTVHELKDKIGEIFNSHDPYEKQNKSKLVLLGAVIGGVLVLGLSAFFIMKSVNTENEEILELAHSQNDDNQKELIFPNVEKDKTLNTQDKVEEKPVSRKNSQRSEETQNESSFKASGRLKNALRDHSISYASKRIHRYNTIVGGPVLKSKSGDVIVVSRSPNFKNLFVKGRVGESGQFKIPLPPPGKIYWKKQGSTRIHVIKIMPPESSHIKILNQEQIPLNTAIRWKHSPYATYYKLAISKTQDFQNGMTKHYSTRDNNVPANRVGTGEYYVKVHAFNKNKGSWEESPAQKITIKNDTHSSL